MKFTPPPLLVKINSLRNLHINLFSFAKWDDYLRGYNLVIYS